MPQYKSAFYLKYNDGVQEQSIFHMSMTQDMATFDIVSATGYKITKIDMPYYNDTDFSGHPVQVPLSFEYHDTKVDDTHHKIQFWVTNGALATFQDNPSKAFIYLPVTTEKATTEKATAVQPVTANFTVRYNDGENTQTITYTNQAAGTITGKVDCANGYQITGINDAYYLVAGMKNHLDNLKSTKVSDTEYNFSFDLSDDDISHFKHSPNGHITLDVDTEEKEQQPLSLDIKVHYNDGVTRQTIDYPNQTAGTVTGTIRAANGYNIISVTEAYYYVAGFKQTLDTFSVSKISDTEFSFSFVIQDDDELQELHNQDITLDVNTVAAGTDITVKYNDGANTQTLNYKGISANQTLSGEINAGKGYTINSVKTAYYKDSYGYKYNVTNFLTVKVSNYKYNFTFELTASDVNKFKQNPNFYITIPVETAKELGNINIDTSGLKNCSVTPSTVKQDTETQITLSADLGYILSGNGSYTVDGISTNFTCNNVDSYKFNVTANKTIAVVFSATKVETKPAAISHTYVLDDVAYNVLGKQFIQAVNAKGDGFEQYDYSNFVNYLYEIPFTVTESITKPTQTLNIGKITLDIPCAYVTHETLNVDLGSIDLPTKDSTDYKINDIALYVPFCDIVELPSSVLGSKIKLSMQINLLNESATLIVTQDESVIVTHETEIFTDLPLYFDTGQKDLVVKTFKTRYQNTIKQAYISIAYNKPITNLTGYATNEHGKLADYKGFTRVSHGTLKESINEEIDSLILDSLTQGVIIK